MCRHWPITAACPDPERLKATPAELAARTQPDRPKPGRRSSRSVPTRRHHETSDSDPAVPFPRPLSEAPGVRRGAFADGERRSSPTPWANTWSATKPTRICSRGAWTASLNAVEQLGRDLDALGVGFGRFVQFCALDAPRAVDDKAIQRGEALVPELSFQGRGADSGGPDVHRAGVSDPTVRRRSAEPDAGR